LESSSCYKLCILERFDWEKKEKRKEKKEKQISKLQGDDS